VLDNGTVKIYCYHHFSTNKNSRIKKNTRTNQTNKKEHELHELY
jgi:hypothetical protein